MTSYTMKIFVIFRLNEFVLDFTGTDDSRFPSPVIFRPKCGSCGRHTIVNGELNAIVNLAAHTIRHASLFDFGVEINITFLFIYFYCLHASYNFLTQTLRLHSSKEFRLQTTGRFWSRLECPSCILKW